MVFFRHNTIEPCHLAQAMTESRGRVVLIIGGGGREHALAMSMDSSPSISAVHVTPGNAGTAAIATNHSIADSDIEGLVKLASELAVDFVIVGPEAPLVAGIADRLRAIEIPCFGPDAENAMLEGSKIIAKQAMSELEVPTSDYLVLSAQLETEVDTNAEGISEGIVEGEYICPSDEDIVEALEVFAGDPWVIKRDVLAGGKGVVVTESKQEAIDFIKSSIKTDGEVILEAFLPGIEASILVIMDEHSAICLPPSQDHKRVGEGDTGPNTGGMGAYCPAPVITPAVHAKIMQRIVKPMHEGLSNQEVPYRGVLFIGLMIDENEDPNVVEFNVRFGDPECQVTLPLVASDFGEMLYYAAIGKLAEHEDEFNDKHCLTVVLASEGYPSTPKKGLPITGTGLSSTGESWVSHAGTKIVDGMLVSSGGRVLSCTAVADTLQQAAEMAYSLLETIELEGSHYRRDIGHHAL